MGLIEQAARRLEQLKKEPDAATLLDESLRLQGAPKIMPRPISTVPRLPALELDLGRLAARGFVTPDVPRSQIADEFRVIKRPLIANAAATGRTALRNANLVMVTSSMPGEGKSFCAVNLAMSMAMELDRTVLLVDADVARPSLPVVLEVPGTPGLMDALLDRSIPLDDLIRRTNVQNLTFLPSGRQHGNAEEMLASDVMVSLLEELARIAADRIVVFDSPPLLVTTEARALAARMGQIVFVVSAEHTPQAEVKRALAAIESCPVKLLVLNKARTAGQGAHGYGYGYGYGSKT
jgi:protein-tyrosine kinase